MPSRLPTEYGCGPGGAAGCCADAPATIPITRAPAAVVHVANCLIEVSMQRMYEVISGGTRHASPLERLEIDLRADLHEARREHRRRREPALRRRGRVGVERLVVR